MNILFDFPIYYINLSRDNEKNALLQGQLKNLNVNRVEAIDGKSIEKELREKGGFFDKSKKHTWSNEEMSASEMGCLLSHLKIFESTVDENSVDYILIVEDDANFLLWKNNTAEDFLVKNYFLHECIQLSFVMTGNNLDYIYKKSTADNLVPYFENWNERVKQNHPWGFAWTTSCYLISKNARKCVLERFKKRTMQDMLRPADFYIYETIPQTVTLIPPIVSQHNFLKSSIQSCVQHHSLSNNFITEKFYKKKLVLISIYFGTLPNYFGLFLQTLKGKDYDFIFVTDQLLDRSTLPQNFHYIFMTLSDLNHSVSQILMEDIELKSFYKLVDLKPLFGSMFSVYIVQKYEYWAWSDIDILFGDISCYLHENPGYDVYSFGKNTFGPLTIFSVEKYIDIHKHVPGYADILKNPSICKIDEMWFFDKIPEPVNFKIYYDIDTPVCYDSRCKNLMDVIENKKLTSLYVFGWEKKDCGICWGIKEKIIRGERSWKWKYEFKNGKFYFQNNEIAFSHLTLLKRMRSVIDILTLNEQISCFQVFFQVNTEEGFLENIDSFNVYEVYDKFINVEITVNDQ